MTRIFSCFPEETMKFSTDWHRISSCRMSLCQFVMIYPWVGVNAKSFQRRIASLSAKRFAIPGFIRKPDI